MFDGTYHGTGSWRLCVYGCGLRSWGLDVSAWRYGLSPFLGWTLEALPESMQPRIPGRALADVDACGLRG